MDGFTYILLSVVCMASGVRFREADTCMLYPLVSNCRGGGWYVMCAKSVAADERGIYHYLLQLSKCKRFVCLF